MRWLGIALAALSIVPAARGEIVYRPVEYRHHAQALEGLFAFDSAVGGRRPGVLLAFEGDANGADARQRAGQLARQGYAVLSADLGGKDRTLVRERAELARAWLARQPQVDAKRIAAVGYGAGGTAWLELARSGADLEAVAVVHGDVSGSNPADAKKISASVFVIVGSDDRTFTPERAAAFDAEMAAGGVDWQVLRLGGVGRDFTNPRAGRDLKSGAAYDADAERRAAAAIKAFLAEALAGPVVPPAAAKPAAPAGIPEKVVRVLEHIDRHGDAMDGYEGGRNFGNFERNLPSTDNQGRRIRYREWDVNPHRPGVNRGAERLVTGSNGTAYYTDDHYRSFKKIR